MNEKYMPSRRSARWAIVLVSALGLLTPGVASQAADEDTPYKIIDGKVDFGTYNGFRRYHSHCHVCHGPDGLGSSYGPALTESLKDLSYDDYMEIVVNGRQNIDHTQQSVMPAFGLVEDVMMSVEDVANGAIDIALVWGPIGGYYARQQTPPLKVTMLESEAGDPPLEFSIAAAVRHGELEWKNRIDSLLTTHRDEIEAILAEHGVPLLDNPTMAARQSDR